MKKSVKCGQFPIFIFFVYILTLFWFLSSASLHMHACLPIGSSQHIAHSFKVYAPQRQKSESVLYMDDDDASSHDDNLHRSSRSNSKLFPINTYIKPSMHESSSASSLSSLNSPESK
jgi:hypothetical protein